MNITKIIMIVYFIVTFLLLIFGKYISPIVSIVDMGQLFFVLGLIFIYGEIKAYKKGSMFPTSLLIMPIFVIVGLGLMLMPVGFYYSNEISNILRLEEEVLLPICVPLIFILFGVIMVIESIIVRGIKNNLNYVIVPGIITGFNCEISENNNKLYAPIIKYSYNGDDLIYEDQKFTNLKIYKKDSVVDLYININNPEDVIYINKIFNNFMIGFGLFFMALGAIIIWYIYLNFSLGVV